MKALTKVHTYLLAGILLLLLPTITQAQHTHFQGTVKAHNTPIIGATVSLVNTTYQTITDENGQFIFKDVPAGKYTVNIRFMGFEQFTKQIELPLSKALHVTLTENSEQLNGVTVEGKNTVQTLNRQAYNITALDAKKLHNTTLDLSHALDKVAGVRVREAGGVGSSFNLSLNGFTGRQVKVFIDGVPMDNFGSSFQLNNIPINLAERIEVYKGVVPIWLGADALGGAINIVTGNSYRNYVDVSYSYGSFNTHKSSVSAGYTAKNGFTVQVNAFQNYSDNNYWVTAEVADLASGLYYDKRVRRFHDNYHNETIIAQVGVVGKKYADRLMFGFTAAQSRADIQTGARMISVFGDYFRKGNTLLPSLKYQKNDLFVKGLNVSFTGNINLGTEQNVDTVARRYNWLGEFSVKPSPGSERERSLYKFRNNNGITTTNISYKLNEYNSFGLSHVFTTFNRKGSDATSPNSQSLKQPRKTQKHILGLGYKLDASPKWSMSVFAKEYLQQNTSSLAYTVDSLGWGNTAYKEQTKSFTKTGYGIATSYYITPKLQLKGSYEKSYRLPENEELFGDVINLEGVDTLRPESSHNINLGVYYQVPTNDMHRLIVEANFILREASDFIRPGLNTNGTKQVMTNQRDVRNTGFDAAITYSFLRRLNIGANVTYQNIRNTTRFENGAKVESAVYKDRMPNMPYLFGNGNAAYTFINFGKKGNNLTFIYDILFVEQYYLRWPSQGTADTKYIIPRQIAHDASVVYTMKEGRYNIAVACKNFTDSNLYDNFSLQKPSRSFNVKFRYSIYQ
ncbi:outer membrane receptor protein involved in Fe transport [Chitinophaga skermanii]|uniref:Outer membrane receptor protein involved in Fe transport n=1 Tax=Chitinophaga skermanii TaxID=331697 RepID=A0A327Q1G0_9BACT|nr:TonB-dependent receptor [Chitinophaga skermanii]RAI97561.1 outer membrane receptor protein involved in Fe transport [Chitinophaga skermanii]